VECNFCQQQQATIFLSQVVKGEVIKLDLCEKCARRLEVSDVQGIAVQDLIQKINVLQEERRLGEKHVCPACGCSLAAFFETGRLGCGACYQAFQEEMKRIFHERQKGERHLGKVPATFQKEFQSFQLSEITERLQEAIQSENYEEAARLRDELRRAGA